MKDNVRKSSNKRRKRRKTYVDYNSDSDYDIYDVKKRPVLDFVPDTEEESEEESKLNAKKKEKTTPTGDESVKYWELYRFATCLDWFCIAFGTAFAIACALSLTYFGVLYGVCTGHYVTYVVRVSNTSITQEEKDLARSIMMDKIFVSSMQGVGLGLLTIVCQYLAGIMFTYSSLRQVRLQKIIRLNIVSESLEHDQ